MSRLLEFMIKDNEWKTSRQWAHVMFGGRSSAPVHHGLVPSWLGILKKDGEVDEDSEGRYRAAEGVLT